MARKFPLKIVDETLKKVFFKLGVVIGNNPVEYIVECASTLSLSVIYCTALNGRATS